MPTANPARASIGLGAAILLCATALVVAQPAPDAPLPPQMTENPMVPEDDATHVAVLTGANEVPPVNTAAAGTAWVMLDEQTNTLTWTVEYDQLTGPATGAHFHGPAEPGENAGVVVNLVTADAIGETTTPIQGTANITPEQAAQLTGGMWYINIHTAQNPNGEIRGQVVVAPIEAEAAAAPAPQQPAPAATEIAVATLMSEGEPLYRRNCSACHGEQGEGGAGDRLVGSPIVAAGGALISQIVVGSPDHGMPPFARLNDREIAAIATYVRNSWGNSYGPVQPSLVAAGRGAAPAE